MYNNKKSLIVQIITHNGLIEQEYSYLISFLIEKAYNGNTWNPPLLSLSL